MAHLSHNAPPAALFTQQEKQALRLLQARYRHDQDLFTERERAQLRFMRWLHRSGRLQECAPLGASRV
jgi:hypothetical protein